jgi:hypothetical protein
VSPVWTDIHLLDVCYYGLRDNCLSAKICTAAFPSAYAFAIYGVLVILYEIFKFLERQSDRIILKLFRDLSIAGPRAILPMVFFVYFSPMGSAHVVSQIQFGNF